jgi:two-component system, chemotaxis family, sensor kinase CheA
MNEDSSSHFDEGLLDDFYVECDQLFGQMRLHLGVLENAPENAASLEQLYRCVHSFKGICGIVGLQAAEQLAHSAEDVLRSCTKGQVAFSRDTLELVLRVLGRMEQIVEAHRLRRELPGIADLMAPLGAYRDGGASPGVFSGSPSPAAGNPSARASAAASSSVPLWSARFLPSAELDVRGVNVASVRKRLAELGTLEKSEPIITQGGVEFHFLVRLGSHTPPDLEAWRADGVELRLEEAPRAAIEEPLSPLSPALGLSIAPSHIVRVDMSRLDDLMRILGETVIGHSRLEERIAHLDGELTATEEASLALKRSLRDLRAAITRVRMVPIAEIFSRMPTAVRDIARAQEKNVGLVLHGQDTEIDKFLVERLKEPLLHLVRNAIGHGVEDAAARSAAGKPAAAVLTLRAASAGHSVVLTIEDDGRGIDVAKVVSRAKALRLPTSDAPDDNELLSLLCLPGFSTRDEADLVSGRGVGMSAVRAAINELGGVMTLETKAGHFTRFTLRLPLTLSIVDAFIVSAGPRDCAVPRALVEEIIQFEDADARPVKQSEVIPYRDGVLPIVRLGKFLGVQAKTRTRIPVLVLASESGLTGLVVDRVHAHREIVVRPMSDPLVRVPGVAGATELGDGRPVLILDPVSLANGVARPRKTSSAPVLARS